MRRLIFTLISGILLGVVSWNYLSLPVSRDWSASEIALIKSLSLSQLPALTPSPSNRVADDPRAIALGHRLFFDTRLSASGTVSCASCHQPAHMFTDGLPLAVGAGVGSRNTPSLVGISHSPWFYWDGRKDSQWSQALAPIEAGIEQDFTRVELTHFLASDPVYAPLYTELFGDLPSLSELPPAASPAGDATEKAAWERMDPQLQQAASRVFSNVGKALAAYQRQIQPAAARFDAYADSLSATQGSTPSSVLNGSEIAGLRLFIGKGQCVSCHNGPLFTNHEFHNTGILPVAGELPSMGRYDGIRTARQDPFNCLGQFSDASASQCTELRFARDSNDLVGAHKTPTLRNVTLTAPYMHSGGMPTLREVLEHYNEAPVSMLSHNEAKPLGLRSVELRQLEAFLQTLTAPLNTDPALLQPPNR